MDGSPLDLRGLSTPRCFDGEEQHWSELRFMFENWLPLLGVDNYLSEAVAEHSAIPSLGDMNPETVKVAKTVYHVLVLHLGGRALATVRLSERFNGIEAWRSLVREYESRSSAARQAAMLAGLLALVWHCGLYSRSE